MDLANRLAEILAAKLGYSDEQRKVIAYGLGALLQMLTLLIIATIFGLAFECFYECMIVFFGVGLMRRTTGGTHCSAYMACILTSSLSICILAFICRYIIPCSQPLWCYIVFGILPGFITFGAFAYKRVPMASKNKPITNPAKIKRLRKQCFITLGIYFIIAIALLLFDWGNGRNISSFYSMIFVLYWQSFTLTSWSSRMAKAMDTLFAIETN